jgi:predicted enzyme related to lactoylglutathione lyase
MPDNVVHFAIHADDLDRARRFYQGVFGWRFEGFGSNDLSGFCKIKNSAGGQPGIIGAMQHRRYNALPQPVLGYECSISVQDVDSTAAAVEANGGKVLMPKTAIPEVGWLIKFRDTEGNLACAIRIDENAK